MTRLTNFPTSFRAMALVVLLIGLPSESLACRLALALAIDVSKSVDTTEFDLQFQGLASAFRDQKVRLAILTGAPVAAPAFHWSSDGRQGMVADWQIFLETADVDRFAEQIERHSRGSFGGETSIGSAVNFARELLVKGPDCARWVIDVSGDGYHNDGRPPFEVYEEFDFYNTTVNALVIGGLARPELRQHFENEVIHGPGAFVLATQSFADYAEAIRLKLIRELSPREVIASANGG